MFFNYREKSLLKMSEMVAVILVLFLFVGCSENRDTSTISEAHPSAWMNIESADFHGQAVLVSGKTGCTACHGKDLDGGEVNVSCLDCHAKLTDVCIACHGGLDNNTGAPPYGLSGETDHTAPAVGAHTVHLTDSRLVAGYECEICHNVPLFVLGEFHFEDNINGTMQPVDTMAEIVWHGISDGGGALWERYSRTCTDTYCHGNFNGGNKTNKPVWTASNQAGCGSCHDVGINPSRLHWKHQYHVKVAELNCEECHASVVNALLSITDLELHVNGTADTLIKDRDVCNSCHGPGGQSCNTCHGGVDNQTGAPPRGLNGEISVDMLAVGAHTVHLEGGLMADAFDCRECHVYPDSLFAEGHLDDYSVAEISWGNLAGLESNWERSTAACGNTYCHGNFDGGNETNTPVWTESNQAECGSCHDDGNDPGLLGGKHELHVEDEDISCYKCHAATVSDQYEIIGLSVHVDGVNNVEFYRQGFYEDRSCSGLGNGCHGREHWDD